VKAGRDGEASTFLEERGLELRDVGSAVAHWWEPLSGRGDPPQRLTMDSVQKVQSNSGWHEYLRISTYEMTALTASMLRRFAHGLKFSGLSIKALTTFLKLR
jgi:hypothetical protein